MLSTVRLSSRLGFRAIRWNSTTANSLPPLMAKFRSDLKTAMREKDKPRLNVLRALISETNNAAKTSSPIQTDLQLLSLIKKKVAASRDASRQFAEANRADLKETEDSQIAVLEEYAGQVETISLEEIKATVSNAITQLQREGGKLNPGLVLKTLLAPGGALDGKPADKSEVAQVVKELLPKN